MKTYYQSMDLTFQKVRLNIRGKEYSGLGFMKWEAEKGFQIEILLDEKYRSTRTGTGKLANFSRMIDQSLIRMQLKSGARAFARISIHSEWQLLLDNRLTVSVNKVISYEKLPKNAPVTPDSWRGSALLYTSSKLFLPDKVNSETRINDRLVNQNHSIGGLDYKDDDIQFVGRMLDDKHLELHWTLSRAKFDRRSAGKWAEGAQLALSILVFQDIRILKHESIFGTQEKAVLIRKTEPERLALYGGGIWRVSHDEIVNLTRFLASDSPHVSVCHHIFEQMVEADRQQTWAATELLLSTILEAALRTIYGYPYIAGGNVNFPRKDCMERFCADYWTSDWEEPSRKALDIFKKMRHRNAHPDWLTVSEGTEIDERHAESVDDMKFLCWFYRYMILGMAGFKNLKVYFP